MAIEVEDGFEKWQGFVISEFLVIRINLVVFAEHIEIIKHSGVGEVNVI